MAQSVTAARHVILVGACYLDTVLNVPHFPAEDSKLRATGLRVRRGGNCPNTLEVLQQLLRHCGGSSSGDIGSSSSPDQTRVVPHLVSCLPAAGSAATARILSSFGEDTLADLSHCLYREGHDEPATCYVLRSQAAGTRTIVNYNGLPEMTAEEFEGVAAGFIGDGQQRSWWHFEGRMPGITLECIRYLRRELPDCRISVEVEKPGREGLRRLASEADVVLYSRAWAESQGYESADACLRGEAASVKASSKRTPSLMFCTWGAQGASALAPGKLSVPMHCPVSNGRAMGQQDLPAVMVDTVGAGDTFMAGLLFGLVCHAADWDTEDTLRFAVDLATRKVHIDGFAGLGAAAATYLAGRGSG